MIRHCILVWGFLLLWCCLGGQNAASAQLQAAEALLDSMQYAQATKLAKKILSSARNAEIKAQAYLLLGDLALKQEDFTRARAQYLRSIKELEGLPKADHPLMAQVWNALGEYELQLNNPTQAIQWHQSALQLRIQLLGQKHEKTADSYNNIGNSYLKLGDYTQARSMHEKALSIRQAVLPSQHDDIAVSHNNLGNCSYFSGDFQGAVKAYRAALQIREKTLGPQHPKITPSLSNLGKVLLELGQWDQALELFQRVLSIRQQNMGTENPALAPTLENIGEVLLEKGDFPSAIPYLQQAVFLYGGQEDPASASAWHKIGLCYQRSGNYDKALQYHLAALGPIESLYGDQVYAATIYNNIAVCYLQKGEYALSIANFSNAATLLKANYPQGHPDLAQMHNSLAICYIRQGFLKEADQNGVLALQALHQIGQNQGIPYAQVLRTRAEILLQSGKIDQSARVLRTALQTLHYRKGQALWGNEITEEVMKVLAQQAQVWKAKAISSKDARQGIQWQKKAAALNLEALRLMGFLRRQLNSATARQLWLQQQYKLYREATELHFRIWQKSGDRSYLDQAFMLSEKSKGAQLLDAVQAGQAGNTSILPSEWTKLEQVLLTQLADLESHKITNPARAPQYERQMLGLMQRLDSLQKMIQRWQKQKGGLSFTPDSAVPAAFLQQRLLNKKQALIEYFETESSLLVFVLRKDKFTGLELTKSPALLNDVVAFRRLLRLYPALNGTALDSNLIEWCQLSHTLQKSIFQPLQKELQGAKELLIVPDGPLSYLPFEALLSKMPQQVHYFKSHPYLLRQYAIQYSYSGSLSWKLSRKSRIHWFKPSMLSLAPDFRQQALGLGALYHNLEEAHQLGKLWGAKVLTGKAASLQNFHKLASQYQILHLATHGKYFRNADNYSALVFAAQQDEKSDIFLYTRDLYALRLPSELVVLSACETGIGDYHSGEGVISLAHGFIHAGANSVVNTLWSVDDARTAELVLGFFQELKKGHSRQRALQNAKLQLLDARPHDEVHPYYWAALVGIGASEPVYDPARKFMLIGLMLVLLILGIGLWKWRNAV